MDFPLEIGSDDFNERDDMNEWEDMRNRLEERDLTEDFEKFIGGD